MKETKKPSGPQIWSEDKWKFKNFLSPLTWQQDNMTDYAIGSTNSASIQTLQVLKRITIRIDWHLINRFEAP